MGADLLVVESPAGAVQAELWPDREDLVLRVKAKSFLHTAKIKGKDEVLCREVCIDLLSGFLSERQIAAKHGISRNTIKGITAVMQERGELEPLSRQVSVALGECIVLSAFRLREALLKGKVSPAQIPIAMGVLIDKKAQLDAGMVPGTNTTQGEAMAANLRGQTEAWLAYQRAKALAADSVSTGEPAQLTGREPATCSQVAPVTPGDTPNVPTASPTTPSATGERALTTREVGGGGIEPPPRAPDPDGKGSENFGP